VENTEERIRTLLQKLLVAGEAESVTLAAELRVLLRVHVDSLRERATSTLRLFPDDDDDDSGSNAAD
jgi:hypothetical protein